jgi:hypothetical protein
MKLEFSNVHYDGKIPTKWDVLLRIVGDFALWVGGRVIYQEVEFCLVEFALALGSWLTVATDLGPDFVYTSLESETEGLVRFTRLKPGTWRVSAAHQDQESTDLLTTAELKSAALTYIRDVRAHLLPKLDILRYVADTKVRRELQSQLE